MEGINSFSFILFWKIPWKSFNVSPTLKSNRVHCSFILRDVWTMYHLIHSEMENGEWNWKSLSASYSTCNRPHWNKSEVLSCCFSWPHNRPFYYKCFDFFFFFLWREIKLHWHTFTDTREQHWEQMPWWAATAKLLREKLGVWCLTQVHLSRECIATNWL